jgi:hypothetical protein
MIYNRPSAYIHDPDYRVEQEVVGVVLVHLVEQTEVV